MCFMCAVLSTSDVLDICVFTFRLETLIRHYWIEGSLIFLIYVIYTSKWVCL